MGIQLYSVRTQMAEDFDATLAAVRAAGYTEVESATLPKLSAKAIRQALDRAGLRCVSSHQGFDDVHARLDEVVEYNKTIGVDFIICSSPGRRTAAKKQGSPLSIDDWRYNAEEFNKIGETMKKVGLRFGYHNHVGEFAKSESTTPYEELMRICEPDKVTFELDCGWAKVAGVDPIALMQRHPHRISMFHVKDFTLPENLSPANQNQAKVTELGHGSIDYAPIFAKASHTQDIKHIFVEQEEFTLPWKESLRVDAEYLKKFPCRVIRSTTASRGARSAQHATAC
jgi:sugar phosphate isomerase/epimerase